VAREQIERHGTLSSVLAHACTVPDPDSVTLCLRAVREALTVASRGMLVRAPVIATSRAAADYLMVSMAHLQVEHLRVLFLNAKNHLIAEEDLARGTVDQAPVYPREIVKRALEVGAASLIIAHNHPSGDPSPSRQDVAITHQIITGATALNIAILDHLVLSASGWTSLRAEGLI
jgi:DNA repair protein RadC